jgi:AcrR family transcriptional regulator
MARPITITDEQILQAARAVFLRKGINATTKEIAKQAGVAESSLFYRFQCKEALFRAAMETTPLSPWVEELDNLVGKGDMQENLRHIAIELIGFTQQIVPMFMLSYGNNPGTPTTEITQGKRIAMRDLAKTAAYLQKESDLGRLRAEHTEIVASVLFGSCVGFVMDALAQKQKRTPEEIETFAHQLISLIWEGAAP